MPSQDVYMEVGPFIVLPYQAMEPVRTFIYIFTFLFTLLGVEIVHEAVQTRPRRLYNTLKTFSTPKSVPVKEFTLLLPGRGRLCREQKPASLHTTSA